MRIKYFNIPINFATLISLVERVHLKFSLNQAVNYYCRIGVKASFLFFSLTPIRLNGYLHISEAEISNDKFKCTRLDRCCDALYGTILLYRFNYVFI